MKTKCGLAVTDNVNRISIENVHKCMVTGCSSERSSVTFAGQESRPYSKTGIHFDDNKYYYYKIAQLRRRTREYCFPSYISI